MKKFFLMMSAALLAVSASAGVVYSWESPAGEVVENGGSIAYVNGDGDRLNYPQADYYTICLNGKKANLNDEAASANAGHMVVTLDEALQAGDKLVFTAFYNKGEEKKTSAYVVFENGGELTTTNVWPDLKIEGSAPATYDYEIPAEAVGSKSFKMTRGDAGTNLFIVKLQVVSEGGAEVETFDLTVTNGKEETAIAAGETAEKLSWYFYAAVPAGAEANHDVEAVLTKDGEAFSTARPGMMDQTTAYWTFRNAAPDYIQEAGVYTLTIPAGAIYTGEADAHTSESAAVELSWTVTGVAETHAISIVSVKNGGNEAGVVEMVTGTFEVELAEPISTIGENQAGAMLINTTTNDIYAISDIIPNGTTAYIRFNIGETSALTVPGVYELQLPEKVLVDEAGNYNEACMGLQWTIEAADYTVINITEVETGIITDDSWGFNDQHFTATMHFTAPEGAAFAFCEGLQLSLNGEDSNVPFQCGDWGMATLEGREVALVFNDGMLCATDDPDYDGDIRPYGSYVGEAEIYFMDADYLELPYVAKFTGSLVFENPCKVELGTPEFNVDQDPFYGQIDIKDLEANGLLVRFPEAVNVNPEMIIKVTATLGTVPPGYGNPSVDEDEEIDPGFGMPEFQEVIEETEFVGDAMFGQAEVNLAEFTQYITEAGAGLFMVTVKSIVVVDSTGEVYKWVEDADAPQVGTVFVVTEDDPTGINTIAADKAGAVIYNLQGQRINAAKGVVIANGKKAIVK